MNTTVKAAEGVLKEKLNEMKEALNGEEKRPIFFIGSGLSRRYLKTPDWKGMLKEISEKAACKYEDLEKLCDGGYEEIAQELEYYCFRNAELKDSEEINHREILRGYIAEIIKKCKDEYNKSNKLYNNKEFNTKINGLLGQIKDIEGESIENLQHDIERYEDISKRVHKYSDSLIQMLEVQELKKIRPRAIITTNYDTLLEDIIFEGQCKSHIGQDGFSAGTSESEDKIDLYKIHGCVKEPKTIIITKEDYDNFFQKGKYLYSKIFTLFWEYPVIFIGYSISDRNIKDILTVMVEIMTEEERKKFEKNVWVVDYAQNEESAVVKEVELFNGKKINVTCFSLKYYYQFYKTINETVRKPEREELKFTISEEAIELLIEPLYQRQDKLKVVVRELLQNALDACKKKNKNKEIHNGVGAEIKIRVFEEDGVGYLEVEDNGIGMDESELKDNFLKVGKTSKMDSCDGLVGKYGIGILSIFLIGKYAKVLTRKAGSELVSIDIFDINQVVRSHEEHQDFHIGTKIKVKLNCSLEKEDVMDVVETLGLDSYVTKPQNSISVIYRNKDEYAVPQVNKPEWFLDVSEKLENENINIQLCQLEYRNVEEAELGEDEKHLKNLLERKNVILYNDMISPVKFDISNYPQLRDVPIPFAVLDVRREIKEDDDVVTNLSRSALQVSGKAMSAIARGVYQLEIDRITQVFSESQEIQEARDIFVLLKNLRNSSVIMNSNVDIMLHRNKIVFSKEKYYFHYKVFGEEKIAREFVEVSSEPVVYKDFIIKNTYVSNLIRDGILICISYRYIRDYILNASNQHNGLRKQELLSIFEVLGIKNIFENMDIAQLWNEIKKQRQVITDAFHKKAPNGILWMRAKNNEIDIQAGEAYFIVFEQSQVNQYLDSDFCEILKKSLNQKNIYNMVDIYEN